jgi:hypothetical protein
LLLAFTALASTSIALTTELAFSCAGRKALLLRAGPLGLSMRRVYRLLDRALPLFSGVAGAASVGLALGAGLASSGGCLGLGAALALLAHYALYAKTGRRFRDDTACLELSKIPPKELAAVQARWEIAMHTRASLLAAAFVCVVASVFVG